MTHKGKSPDQIASSASKRLATGTERLDPMTHKGEPPDQVVSDAGKRPASGTERADTMTHRGEPPGQSKPGTGRRPVSQWTACAAQSMDRPFGSSYFVPGRVEEKLVLCLLDSGCTTNLVGKHVFDRLSERLKGQLVKSDTHGMMADGLSTR